MTARRFLTSTFAAALLVAVLAAPARAAPVLTLEPLCDDQRAGYMISMSLSGLEPYEQFRAYVSTPDFYAGPSSFTADANGRFDYQLGWGAPNVWTVQATVRSEVIEKTLEVNCADFITGGSVVGEGDSQIRYGGEEHDLHWVFDAHSETPSTGATGTVREQFEGHDITGRVTCVSTYSHMAAVGVVFDDPPAGIPAGQILRAHDGLNDSVQIDLTDTPPTECPAPRGSTWGGVTAGGFAIQGPEEDTEPPEPVLAPLVVINATSPSGTEARYFAYARDDLDPAPTVECSPRRGNPIPVGLTKVTCTASDRAGNSVTQTFRLVVRGGITQLEELRRLVVGYDLPRSPRWRLTGWLDASIAGARSKRTWLTCTSLRGFQRLALRESGQALTQHQAGRLAADAGKALGALGCLPPPTAATSPVIRLAPECGNEVPDVGSPGYGASIRLAGFPPDTPVRIEVDTELSYGVTLEETTDAQGGWGPWLGSVTAPVGLVSVDAFAPDGRLLASATLDDPCLAPLSQP